MKILNKISKPYYPRISVIIPVFNSEKHLKKCLYSVLKQTEKNFEVILIDDGSTDSSKEICDSFHDLDPRIKVIHKKNEGVSIARNVGISESKGEYITFLDSDDFLDENELRTAYQEISESCADMVVWNFYFLTGSYARRNPDFPSSALYCGKDLANELIATTLHPRIKSINTPRKELIGMVYVWNKLFKSEIIKNNGIAFDSGIILNEDMCFVCKYLKYVEKIKFIDQPYYYYRVTDNGAMLRYKPEIISSNKNMFSILDDCLSDQSKIQKEAYNCRIIRALVYVVKFYFFHRDYNDGKRIRSFLELIRTNQHYSNAIKDVRLKYLSFKQRLLVCLLKPLILG